MDPMINAFAVFNLDPKFDLDETLLHQRYSEAMMSLHPDHHLSAPRWLQIHISQQAEQLNSSYRLLKDPLERAQLLLKEAHIDLAQITLSQDCMMDLFERHSKIETLSLEQQSPYRQQLKEEFKKNLVRLGSYFQEKQWQNAAQMYHFLRALHQLIKRFG